MFAPIDRESAARVVFTPSSWMWLSAPAFLYLAWGFFLPTLWKLLLLIVASLSCSFVDPCVIGSGVNGGQVWLMMVAHGILLFLVFWYSVYAFAYLQKPGTANRALGVTAVLAFPVLLIGSALVIGIGGELVGLPLDDFWSYYDRWTPIDAWKVRR